ncbi:MAG: nitroreductase/quinone reductase family protein [Acidimicrobiia bacterium]
MTDPVVVALARGGIVGITTTGRTSGRPHTVDVTLHNVDRKLVIAGRPGPRDWYANLQADPHFTIQLSGGVEADIEATAEPVTDWSARRTLMERVMIKGFGFSPERTQRELHFWVTRSPLVLVNAAWPGWVNTPN